MNLHEHLGLPAVEADLARLEGLLNESVVFGDEYLDSVTTHLIKAGGKRLRPLLALAAATGGDRPATADELLGAVAVELMHLASLYHDDVMDEAVVRRSVDSVNARYGNLMAIVAGDYLMARCAAISADLGQPIAALMAATLAALTRGQVAEVRTCFDVHRDEANYFAAIEGKTAALLSTSCRVGAMVAGRPHREIEALAEFGREFGVLFQLRDDILDLTADVEDWGKEPGQDLGEGIYTLPTLFALRDPRIGSELAELLGGPLDVAARSRARELVLATDGVAQTRAAGRDCLLRATASLDGVADGPLRRGLAALTTALLDPLPA